MRETLEVETTWSVSPSKRSEHFDNLEDALRELERVILIPGVHFADIHKWEKVLR